MSGNSYSLGLWRKKIRTRMLPPKARTVRGLRGDVPSAKGFCRPTCWKLHSLENISLIVFYCKKIMELKTFFFVTKEHKKVSLKANGPEIFPRKSFNFTHRNFL